MAHSHIPNLTAIEAIVDREIQFYSIIGAAISLSAGLELVLLDIFTKGLRIDPKLAAQVLFQARNSSLQRDQAIAAMSARLNGGPLSQAWNDLQKRIVTATGQSGSRHLLAHNAVRTFMRGGGGFGMGPISGGPISGSPTMHFLVEQDQRKVLAGTQKPKREDFRSLVMFCREMIDLLKDLDSFLTQVP